MSTPDGKPLHQLLRSERIEPQRALAIGVSIANALAPFHAGRGPFGLPRPSNVLISSTGEASFAALEPPAEPSDVAYCSPEEWEGKPLLPQSDIFTLGAILFELLTGVQPFKRESIEATHAAVLAAERPSIRGHNPQLTEILDFVVSQCLRVDPARRFPSIEELRAALEELEEHYSQPAGHSHADTSRRGYRMLGAIGVASVLVGAVAVWVLLSNKSREGYSPASSAVALLANSGTIVAPAFSPAGNQIAFSWNGEKQDNFDIYVKPLGAGSQQRLTTHPDSDVSPVWSPDGRYLAFVRNSATRAAIMVMPANGGAERKLHEFTRTTLPQRYRMLAWSPDGQWLAFPATDDPTRGGSIYLLSLTNGEIRRLTEPPAGSTFGDAAPAFSRDGRRLAFVRTFTVNVGDIFVLPLANYSPDGKPVRLTTTGAVTNPVWAPDQHDLVFTRFQGTSTLWRMRAEPGSKAGPMDGIGELGNFADLALPRDRSGLGRLVYVRSIWDENIWRISVSHGVSRGEPEALITSTRRDWEPHVSPDGKLVSFSSERSGPAEIWVSDPQGGNPRRLTWLRSFAAASRWSPDGTRIAFVTDIHGQYEIYIGNIATGQLTRLTDSPAHETAPSWSRDGKWVYFASNREGLFQIWKQPPNPNAPAVQVTETEALAGIESPDGSTLYYTKQSPNDGIWRRPVSGGPESRIIPSVSAWGNFDVCADGIYFSTFTAPRSVQYYEFATHAIRTVLTAPKPLGFGIGVSPDGSTLLYTSIDQQANELMIVENFR